MNKRKLELAVLSDIHLGSMACHADECLSYLNSIKPKILVLNGGIIDFSRLNKAYFPSTHMKIVKKIISMASKGTEVYYVVGHHQKRIRKFSGVSIGNLHIVEKLILNLNGKKAWFFHGGVFNNSLKIITWLSKLEVKNYKCFIKLNTFFNYILLKNKRKYSSKNTKNKVQGTTAYISRFEKCIANIAIENDYDFAVCGHTHLPKKEIKQSPKGNCIYLNSGDWVKSLTALEYSFKRWKIYTYNSDKLLPFYVDEDIKEMDIQKLNSIITEQKRNKEEDRKKQQHLSLLIDEQL